MQSKYILLPAIIAIISLFGCANDNTIDPHDKDLKMMEPAHLAAIIQDSSAMQPLIYNLGPFAELKGAIDIGPGEDDENIEKLKVALNGVPKDREMVIYCGCCPFDKCPNVLPAMRLLKDNGYTNAYLLDLSTNFKTDWLNKGYPVNR
jgi:hypothetical protein